MSQEKTIIGVMSGTSLDGLDLCAARFKKTESHYDFEILATETIPYDRSLKELLINAFRSKGDQIKKDSIEFGLYIAEKVDYLIRKYSLNDVNLIGSHGHTIFHEPDKGITVQIGDGDTIAKKTGIPTISDFRILDVKLGGQGAPLVPIGDLFLFNEYEACLNLGGIANISFDQNNIRIAFDIAPCNLPLNKIAKEEFDLNFDKDGTLARTGQLVAGLFEELNNLLYYKQNHPKSLGVEWLNNNFYPIVEKYTHESPENLLYTIVQHETDQIAEVLNQNELKSCLVTGGGALNNFFIERLQSKSNCKIIIPNKEIVEFKEALIFAFLAYLNSIDEVNTLKSVTGASKDSIGGILHKSF